MHSGEISLTILAIWAIGLIVPRTLDIRVIDTTFVLLLTNLSKVDKSNMPPSVIGIYLIVIRRFAFVFSRPATNCHGTIFEWCSISDNKISSLSLKNVSRE